MVKPINEHLIKISSRLSTATQIQLGDDVFMHLHGGEYILNCVKTEDMDNQDGTINRVYTLKYLGE